MTESYPSATRPDVTARTQTLSVGTLAALAIVVAIVGAAWMSLQSNRYVMRGEGTLTVILDTATGEVKTCYSERSTGGTCHIMENAR